MRTLAHMGTQAATVIAFLTVSLCIVAAEKEPWFKAEPLPVRGGAVIFVRDVKGEFEVANRSYEEARFADAVLAYEKMLAAGQSSAAVVFNLGNAHFKSGQLGRAIVAYREAELLAPRDPDVLANLQFARNRAAGGLADAPPPWKRALAALTLNEWTALAAVCLWILLALLALGQWRPKWKAQLRPFARGSACAVAAFAVCLVVSWQFGFGRPTAVVTLPEVNVRYGPLDESKTFFTLRDGAEVRVIGRKDDWLQVVDVSQRAGWVKLSLVTEFPRKPGERAGG